MTRSEASDRIVKLRKQINDYRYRYHVLNESTMSEAAADSLKHELSQLEEQFPDLVTPDSPTQRVAGGVLPGFSSVKHDSRMLSLQDVFNREELEKWVKRIAKIAPKDWDPEFHLDLKLDGLAMSLVYEDGMLVRGATRGDGTVGEDVTANIKTIDSIPLSIPDKQRVEVRGEVLMYKDDFDQLNRERANAGEELFKNPRNTAAGTLRQLDNDLVASRPLKFHAWSVIKGGIKTRMEENQYAKQTGFIVNPETVVVRSVDEIIEFADKWGVRRDDLPFGIDGLVIHVNDKEIFKRLGVVGKAPRGAVAYKYPAEEATTKVKDIIISVGRTGVATPVAVLEPVDVAGSTVQHASLHNQDEIERKDIRIGDTVIIHKAGDIIPQIVRVLTDLRTGREKKFDMARELSAHQLDFERVEGEAAWRAVGRNDPHILKKSLEHFASKGNLDIDGMGEKNVELLVDEGLVKDIADIYQLERKDILSLERFAELSTDNLLKAIEDKKHPEFWRFLAGLGIRHVGAQTSIDLAERYQDLDKLAEAALERPEELYEIDGIGEVVARSIIEWFSDDSNQNLLGKFKKFGVWPSETASGEGKLSGQSFVVTGTLESMGRDEVADKIRALGGKFQSSVGNDTTYLVMGTKAGASKRKKAESLGTKVINEKDLLSLLSA